MIPGAIFAAFIAVIMIAWRYSKSGETEEIEAKAKEDAQKISAKVDDLTHHKSCAVPTAGTAYEAMSSLSVLVTDQRCNACKKQQNARSKLKKLEEKKDQEILNVARKRNAMLALAVLGFAIAVLLVILRFSIPEPAVIHFTG